jgi:SagB-type dehydrogenase family enzyme
MAKAKLATRYRVSPNLVCFWRDGKLRVLNFATRCDIHVDAVLAGLLARLGDWHTAAEAASIVGLSGTREIRALLQRLVRASVLHSSTTSPPTEDRAMSAWAPWNPAVGFFHSTSSRVTYVEKDLPVDGRTTPRKIRGAVIRRAGLMEQLEVPDTSQLFPSILLKRRTWRRFAPGKVSRQSLETVLWLTAGVQGWLRTPRGERLPLTTSPSGGARHPIELFVLAKHVDGLRAGLYRYDGVAHGLESIGPPPSKTRDYLPRQHWYENAAVVVFLCATFRETLARYPYPRAYRAVLLEAGHVCQTFCLAATWLGLAPFCTMALDDRRIERDLGLDGLTTSVLYAAGAGLPAGHGVPAAPSRTRGVSIDRRQSQKR